MRNLQVGDTDLIGSRFNGHDLHRFLRERGVESDHVVKAKRSDDPHTHLFDEPAAWATCNVEVAAAERRYGIHSVHAPLAASLLSNPLFLEADVVHYHLLHNASFNLGLLPLLTRLKPSVWTIHDAWALTGHCVQPLDCERWKIGCGDCPYPDTPFAMETDTSAVNWELKREIMQRCRMDLIVASRFMRGLVEQSPIFAGFTTHLVPFGLDLERFAPQDPREARRRLGIPPDDVVICFRSDPSRFKGLPFIKQMLAGLATDAPVTLLTVGMPGLLEEFGGRFGVVEMGWLTDDQRMLDVYHAADLFVMPSVAEAFGMMAMEAMACGRPVVVFDGTALPEVVAAPEGGVVVPQGDVDGLLREVSSLVASEGRRREVGERARGVAERLYDKETYLSRILAVYEEVIARHPADDRVAFILDQQRRNIGRTGLPVVSSQASESPDPTPVESEVRPRFKASAHYRIYRDLLSRRHMRLAAILFFRPVMYAAWWLSERLPASRA